MPTRLCLDETCPEVAVRGGRCAKHARSHDRSRRPTGHDVYRTKRWAILRRRVLFEQPLCSCGVLAVEVDHIVPLADGGAPYARANVQALCPTCHGRKTREERRARRASA